MKQILVENHKLLGSHWMLMLNLLMILLLNLLMKFYGLVEGGSRFVLWPQEATDLSHANTLHGNSFPAHPHSAMQVDDGRVDFGFLGSIDSLQYLKLAAGVETGFVCCDPPLRRSPLIASTIGATLSFGERCVSWAFWATSSSVPTSRTP